MGVGLSKVVANSLRFISKCFPYDSWPEHSLRTISNDVLYKSVECNECKARIWIDRPTAVAHCAGCNRNICWVCSPSHYNMKWSGDERIWVNHRGRPDGRWCSPFCRVCGSNVSPEKLLLFPNGTFQHMHGWCKRCYLCGKNDDDPKGYRWHLEHNPNQGTWVICGPKNYQGSPQEARAACLRASVKVAEVLSARGISGLPALLIKGAILDTKQDVAWVHACPDPGYENRKPGLWTCNTCYGN